MQKPYLVYIRGDEFPKQTNLNRVSYRPITEVYKTERIEGLVVLPFARATGKVDKSKLELWTDGHNYSVDATHDGIKLKFRKLREQEAIQLDEIDAQIKALREQRTQVLRTAWQKAHVVTVKELIEAIT